MGKQKTINCRKIFIFIIIIIILVIMLAFCIIKTKIEKNNNNDLTENVLSIQDQLVGSWSADGVTIYEFDKDNKGKLKVPLGDYDFIYKLEENKIYIDFENERSTDSDYEITFQEDKLIFKGINQTVGTYTFTHFLN